ncbi:MAG: right-handed parallel beta-helix repeat-containing protein [Aphanocapsa sp. GSE-SYN-MK-11-07L]|jgi:parallel beta-helix repeat protein|nr:right-handed parallel beta-helix repeat-containing protein [Aphanocapsa sp. GSE-SYN-MK-11-07L]
MKRRHFLRWFGLGFLANSSTLLIGIKQKFVSAAPQNSPKQTVFYVSVNGNDAWTGGVANPNQTKTDGPFATLERARDAIRKIKGQRSGTLNQSVTVFIRGGTYFLSKQFEFTAEDSGMQKFSITYRAYQNEKPIISGGQRLKGWQQVVLNGKRLWMIEIPQVKGGQRFFRQLWVNGQRRPRARYPKKGYLKVAEVPDATAATPWNVGQSRFNYFQGDLKNWSGLENAEIVIMTRWVESRLPIARIDPSQRLVYLGLPSFQKMEPGNAQTSGAAVYYIENIVEVLDTPGEWCLDKRLGRLYYMPKQGEDIKAVEAIIPRLSRLINLQGNPANSKFIEHLTFQNLTFAHSEWYYPADSKRHGSIQAAVSVPGAIYGEGIRSCTFQNCQVTHVSNYGIEFANGCTNNSVDSCLMSDLGAGGIKVNQGASATKITKCQIKNGGKIFHSAVGILVMNSPNNLISRNNISDFYYTGISVGWTWGYEPSPTKNNIVEFNNIHHIGLLSNGDGPILNDKGGIYILGVQPGTVIRGNVIHTIDAYSAGAWGIYLDEGSSQILVEKNVVYRTRDGGFHQHYGKNNSIRNNIFAFGRISQITRSKLENHSSFTFERNIVYWKEGQLLSGKWDDANYAFDHNLYWNVGKRNILFGKLSWQEWQKKGMDIHSLIADPLFTAPDKGDFRLKPGSPASKLEIGK